jgi:hypothetical protein
MSIVEREGVFILFFCTYFNRIQINSITRVLFNLHSHTINVNLSLQIEYNTLPPPVASVFSCRDVQALLVRTTPFVSYVHRFF